MAMINRIFELQCWELKSCSSCVLSLNGCEVNCPSRKRTYFVLLP